MYKQKVAEKDLEELYEAMLSLDNTEEFHSFFEDLCTVDELKSLAQRWQVAQMLFEKNKYKLNIHIVQLKNYHHAGNRN